MNEEFASRREPVAVLFHHSAFCIRLLTHRRQHRRRQRISRKKSQKTQKKKSLAPFAPFCGNEISKPKQPQPAPTSPPPQISGQP
jgi:hypothetical protein